MNPVLPQLTHLAKMGKMLLRSETRSMGEQFMPRHAVTGIEFKSLNALILLAENKGAEHEYLTLGDLVAYDASFPEEAPGTQLWFYETKSVQKHFYVFQLNQCSGAGLEVLRRGNTRNRLQLVSSISGFLATVGIHQETTSGPSYFSEDAGGRVYLSEKINAEAVDVEFSTVFSGIIHWARHLSRLVQYHPQGESAQSPHREYENLVAEIGAAFLAAHFGLHYAPRDTVYNSGWEQMIADCPEAIKAAAADAQLAVDYLFNVVFDKMASHYEESTILER